MRGCEEATRMVSGVHYSLTREGKGRREEGKEEREEGKEEGRKEGRKKK